MPHDSQVKSEKVLIAASFTKNETTGWMVSLGHDSKGDPKNRHPE
ncbi:MAG: hypothetical protein ACI87A_003340 [Planctomycetota bacterium]|jgi:hypothetical protein